MYHIFSIQSSKLEQLSSCVKGVKKKPLQINAMGGGGMPSTEFFGTNLA